MKAQHIENGEYKIYCEGCRHHHFINTQERNSNNAIWKFNGDLNRPTFIPSIHIKVEGVSICHFTITDGIIKYENDCEHDLRESTRPLTEIA